MWTNLRKGLRRLRNTGKLIVKDGWVICPICGKGKILKINPDTTVHGLPIKCKLCRQESIVNIDAPEPASKRTSA